MPMRAAMPLAGTLLLAASLSGCLGVDNMAEFKAALGFQPLPAEVLPPLARLRASPTLAATGQPVAFSAQGSLDPHGGTLDYRWDFGDGASAAGSEVTHRYARAGTYTATLRAVSAQGLTGTDTLLLTIVENRPPVVAFEVAREAQPVERALAGEELRFRADARDPEGMPLTLAWDFGDGTTALTAEARHAFATGGRHSVTLRAEDASGLASSASRTVVIDHVLRERGDVAPLTPRGEHALPVAPGAQRLLASVAFEAMFGLNALTLELRDRDGAVVKAAPARPPPGTQGVFEAVLEALPEDLQAHPPGPWTLVVNHASGLQVAYAFTAELRY